MSGVGCGTAFTEAPADAGGGVGDAGATPDTGTPDGVSPADGGGDGPACAATCSGQCTDIGSDPMNCGGCGSLCTGGTCAQGLCTLVPSSDAGITQVGDYSCLAVDSLNVYVATGKDPGAIYAVPIAGGSPISVAQNQNAPRGIASDGTDLYWANSGDGTVMTATIANASPQLLVQSYAGLRDLGIDQSHVFWNNDSDGTLWQVDRAGTTLTKLATLAGKNVGYFAIGSARIYYTDPNSGAVSSVLFGGATPPSLLVMLNQARPIGATVTLTNLYFSNASTASTGSTGSIMSISFLGSSAPTAIASNLNSPGDVKNDSGNLYFTEATASGTIKRVSETGGTVTTLASNQATPSCIAIDKTSVYWINTGTGAVMKTGK